MVYSLIFLTTLYRHLAGCFQPIVVLSDTESPIIFLVYFQKPLLFFVFSISHNLLRHIMRLEARPRVFDPCHKEVALPVQLFAHGVDINVLAQCRIGFGVQVVLVVFQEVKEVGLEVLGSLIKNLDELFDVTAVRKQKAVFHHCDGRHQPTHAAIQHRPTAGLVEIIHGLAAIKLTHDLGKGRSVEYSRGKHVEMSANHVEFDAV